MRLTRQSDRWVGRLCEDELLLANLDPWHLNPGSTAFALLATHALDCMARPGWAARFNAALNLLLCVGARAAPVAAQFCPRLSAQFLVSDTVAPVARALLQIEAELPLDQHLIFVGTDRLSAIAFERQAFIDAFVRTRHGTSCFYLFARAAPHARYVNMPISSLEQAFSPFPLLHAIYSVRRQKLAACAAHLQSLDLDRGVGRYHDDFVAALSQRCYATKLVALEIQIELSTLFRPLLNRRPDETPEPNQLLATLLITPVHLATLTAAYPQLGAAPLAERQAALLWVLAMMFVRYSSAVVFGTEDESPVALRYYALALLNTALTLWPSGQVRTESALVYRRWLMGPTAGCSGYLADVMLTDIRGWAATAPLLQQALEQVYPDDWL